MPETTQPDLPTPLPWDQRFKGVQPMPGGQDNFLKFLTQLCRYVDKHHMTQNILNDWITREFGIKLASAGFKTSFLRTVELLEVTDGIVSVAPAARTWLESGDNAFLLGQIHSRIQFVGELLHEVRVAEDSGGSLNTSELLSAANDRFGLGWRKPNQVSFRRGWLQSAGLIRMTSDHRHEITQAGRDLLQRLVLHKPTAKEAPPSVDLGQYPSTPEAQVGVMPETTHTDLPTPLPWDQRFKGVQPMPGGYDGYLDSLEELCQYVDDHLPNPDSLIDWVRTHFDVTLTSAQYRTRFLRKLGILEVSHDNFGIAAPTRTWREKGDHARLIAHIHSRTQFIGEMLHVVRAAQDRGDTLQASELLSVANDQYGLGWTTVGLLNNRRGWLQSAGLISMSSDNRFEITPAGRELLQRLELHEPTSDAAHAPAKPTEEPLAAPRTPLSSPTPDSPEPGLDEHPKMAEQITTISRANALAQELRESSTDSTRHTRFEAAVRDAFEFLGFRAMQLGGSGKTDVLLEACRGKDHSYSVTVDAKSVGASGAAKGQLRDSQVDWVTLREHREQQGADYSLLVGPTPTGDRLFSRAEDYGVAIMPADALAALCRLHEMAPLDLGTYENLFLAGGGADVDPVGEAIDAGARRRSLAAAVFRTLIDQCAKFGPMSARDLSLTLQLQDVEQSWEEDEIADVLGALSSGLVGIIEVASRSSDGMARYIPATSLASAQLRLRALADALNRDDQ